MSQYIGKIRANSPQLEKFLNEIRNKKPPEKTTTPDNVSDRDKNKPDPVGR